MHFKLSRMTGQPLISSTAEEKSILSLVWVVVLEKLPHCVNVLVQFSAQVSISFSKLQEECILEKQAFHQKHLTA